MKGNVVLTNVFFSFMSIQVMIITSKEKCVRSILAMKALFLGIQFTRADNTLDQTCHLNDKIF
jgi:hypothetical protein